ncbi:MAG: hypothetical protein ACRDYU_18595 [Actinomycetes bacterium]
MPPCARGLAPSGQWEALEDKATVDDLWDSLGITRAPSRVVPAERGAMAAAGAALDGGLGTVWSGDALEGFNGGGEYVRWVRSAASADEAAAFLAAHCARVRVMPFLDGVPCSVHGFAFPDGDVALRPVEMVTMRRPAGHPEEHRFVYGGASTWWDPPPGDRDAMRDVARRVAAELRRRVVYRGGFSVDGVLTAEGFVPTEINPRFTGGLNTIGRAIEEVPLLLVQAALVSGYDPGLRADEFETLVLGAADAHRSGSGIVLSPHVSPGTTQSAPVRFEGDPGASSGGPRCRWAGDAKPPDGMLELGPAAVGGLVRLALDPDRTTPGPPVAGRTVAALALADETWGTGVGPLVPAPSLRGDAAQG